MYMPSILGLDRFDDFFDFSFPEFKREPGRGFRPAGPCKGPSSLMKTDIKDTGDKYELDIDLPGFKKEDLDLSLDKGVLKVSATRKDEHEEGDEEGKYLKRERFVGSVSRSFYVGENISHDDIQAKFADGILSLTVPKEDKAAVETAKRILIA